MYYLEYWYFLGYNELRYDDQTIQDVWHEGDWEHVSIKLYVTPGTPHGTYSPDLVNFYQHKGGYTRDPEDCWWSSNSGQLQFGYDNDHKRLNVWLAKNSHASYNRYDEVYNVRIVILGEEIEDYTDNPDYGMYNPFYFDYSSLINLGERSYASPYWCTSSYPPGYSFWMDDHWMPNGTSTEYNEWAGYMGNTYWMDEWGDPETACTPPPTAPGVNEYWGQFPVDDFFFCNETFPIYWWNWQLGWLSWVPDPATGDYWPPWIKPYTPEYNSDNVEIGWYPPNPDDAVAEYRVYRVLTDDDPTPQMFSLIATLSDTDTCYTDTSVTVPNSESENTLYYYISSVDTSDEESDPSEFLRLNLPMPPENLSGHPVDSLRYVLLTWDPNLEENLAGYDVFREIRSGDSVITRFSKLNAYIVTDTTYTDDDFILSQQGTQRAFYYVVAINLDHGISMPSDTVNGRGETVIDSHAENPLLVCQTISEDKFSIFPNPFNSSTMIRFASSKAGPASIVLYNIMGQRVIALFDGFAEASKEYLIKLDGIDLATGVYVCHLKTAASDMKSKMLLLK